MHDNVLVNDRGGKSHDIGARFDLLPATAMWHVARALNEGARKYGKDNWRLLSVDEQINHCAGHIFSAQVERQRPTGEVKDAVALDLAHAACRALMALETHLTGQWTEASNERVGA